MYFAFAELREIDLYFLLYQENVVDPILEVPPDVLFLLDGILAQSASLKP